MSLDTLLVRAKGLYKDRQRIALATFMIVFALTFYAFYVPGIYSLTDEIPSWFSGGWAQGFELVYSFNTVGFFFAFALMAFAYAFWSWAFLPSPATIYTIGVLKGVFGSDIHMKQSIGKRFHLTTREGIEIDVKCRIKQHGTDDWFVYRIQSMPLSSPKLDSIALRHGFSNKAGRIASWVSYDELHSRSLLLLKAIQLASA
ncbi:MAG: hypothetical protein JW779_05430 [Candidatus Thorarchaeota archaeon]|nr:hypothetical protein [Candidatus Thorarchaeota archaeon]